MNRLQKQSPKTIISISLFLILFLIRINFAQEIDSDKYEKYVDITPAAVTEQISILCGNEKWLCDTCIVSIPKSIKFIFQNNEPSKYIKISTESFEEISYNHHRYVYSIQISPFAPKGIYPINGDLEITRHGNAEKVYIPVKHTIKVIERDVKNPEDLDFYKNCINYYTDKNLEFTEKSQAALNNFARALAKSVQGKSSLGEEDDKNVYNELKCKEIARQYLVKRRICCNHLLSATKSQNQKIRKNALAIVQELKAQEKFSSNFEQ